MKITILYNKVTQIENGKPEDLLADEDTIRTANEINSSLVNLGYLTELFCVDETSVGKITGDYPTDLFFNNAFGIGNASKSEGDLVGIIEKTGIPFTGATEKNIILTSDKVATKDVLQAFEIPTPGFAMFSSQKKIKTDMKFPLFVKPSGEDCSFGITQSSVVQNEAELKKKIAELIELYHEGVLVEEYIEGRELNVSIMGKNKDLFVLPISEIIFGPKFPGKYHIVDFDSKWNECSDFFLETNGVCPAVLDKDVKEKIEKIAEKAFKVTGCRHFARVDMRLDNNGQPWVLEVNANPAIGKKDGFVRSARAAGYNYESFLDFLVKLAVE